MSERAQAGIEFEEQLQDWYTDIWMLLQDPTANGTMPEAVVQMIEIFNGMFKSDVDDLLDYAKEQL